MKGFLIVAGILTVASVLPIFRGAGHSRRDGVSLWTLLYDSTHLTPESPFGHPHLPYEEAVRRAQEAWLEIQEGSNAT